MHAVTSEETSGEAFPGSPAASEIAVHWKDKLTLHKHTHTHTHTHIHMHVHTVFHTCTHRQIGPCSSVHEIIR